MEGNRHSDHVRPVQRFQLNSDHKTKEGNELWWRLAWCVQTLRMDTQVDPPKLIILSKASRTCDLVRRQQRTGRVRTKPAFGARHAETSRCLLFNSTVSANRGTPLPGVPRLRAVPPKSSALPGMDSQ